MSHNTEYQKRMNIRHPNDGKHGTSKLQRMFKHVYNSLRVEGVADADAVRIAAARVNQHRADIGITIEEIGRAKASRYGWWPGKKVRRK